MLAFVTEDMVSVAMLAEAESNTCASPHPSGHEGGMKQICGKTVSDSAVMGDSFTS